MSSFLYCMALKGVAVVGGGMAVLGVGTLHWDTGGRYSTLYCTHPPSPDGKNCTCPHCYQLPFPTHTLPLITKK